MRQCLARKEGEERRRRNTQILVPHSVQFVFVHTHSSIVGLVHQRLDVHGPLPQLLLGPIVIALCMNICVVWVLVSESLCCVGACQ